MYFVALEGRKKVEKRNFTFFRNKLIRIMETKSKEKIIKNKNLEINVIDNKEKNCFVDRNYPKEDNNNNIEINEKENQIINVIINNNNEMASPENMEQKKIILIL